MPRFAIVQRGLSWPGAGWAFRETNFFANWVPLSVLSHMLDWQLFGGDPRGHHLTSVLLHALTVSLVFLFWQRASGHAGAAAAVAALWGLHPLRVESVVWIAERKDVLSGCLGALCLLLYVRWARSPSAARYAATLVALVAALLAKSMMMTLPAVMLLVDVWPLRRLTAGEGGAGEWLRATRPRVREKLPLIAAGAIVGLLALAFQQRSGAVAGLTHVPFPTRLATAVLAVPQYLASAMWPVRLSPFYSRPAAMPSVLVLGGAALLVLGVTALAIASLRRAPWLGVGWLWFLGMLLPILGLVQVGEQARADRYTYFPAIGLTAALVWGAAAIVRGRSSRQVSALLVTLALLGCATATRAQIRHWRNTEALFRRAVEVEPASGILVLRLANAESAAGHLDAALAHYGRAAVLRPGDAQAWTGLGETLLARGDTGDAVRALRHAVALDPSFVPARVLLDRARGAAPSAPPSAGTRAPSRS